MKRLQIELGRLEGGHLIGGVGVERSGNGADLSITCMGTTNQVYLGRGEIAQLRKLLATLEPEVNGGDGRCPDCDAERIAELEGWVRDTANILDPDCPDIDAYVDGHCALTSAAQGVLGRAEKVEKARIESDRAAQDARNDNAGINRELDRLNAPRLQSSGFGYSPIGRLRTLARGECGRGLCEALEHERDEWKKKAHEAQEKVAGMESELRAVSKLAELREVNIVSAQTQHAEMEEAIAGKDVRIAELETEIERDTSLAQMAELEDQVVRVIKRAEQAERERDELAEAWITVCHEGNVPQYEHVASADAGGILHGVRQLASMWSAEKTLREVVEHELDHREVK